MAPSWTIHGAVAIFFGINLIVGIRTDATSSLNSQAIKPNIEPLSPDNFSQDLRQLLSPEIFTQSDPFHYLLGKAIKLPYRVMDKVNKEMENHFQTSSETRFPPAYLPYAKLLCLQMDLLSDLTNLQFGIRDIKKYNPPFPLPDIQSVDTEISSLFTADIFSDPNPPSVLVDKLLALPESGFESVVEKLEYSALNIRIIQYYYYWYCTYLKQPFKRPHGWTALVNLKRYVAEMQIKL
ncbi:uncharacterized protein LOC135848121 [Planococcus citri]|uniref:uncharacterized protein LOC135847411 n=1 Tax=Planococcus citri TaxID=170843 RepID=UPI0031F92CBC